MIWAYGPPRPGEQEPRGTAWDFSDSVFSVSDEGITTQSRYEITDYNLKILQNPIVDGNVKIQYSLPKPSKVKVVIYNAIGQVEKVLAESMTSPGIYELAMPENLPSDIYFIQLQTAEKIITLKIINLRE
jgi:hypothetical protein